MNANQQYLSVPGNSNGKLVIWLKRAITFLIGQINGIPKGKSFLWSVFNVVEQFSQIWKKITENYNPCTLYVIFTSFIMAVTVKWMRFICFCMHKIHKMISFLNFFHSKLRRSSGFYYIVSTYCESCANITVFFSADTYDIERTYNGIGRDSKKIYILCKFFGIFNTENSETRICIRFAWENFITGWVRVNILASIFNNIHSNRKKNPMYDVNTFIESLLLT